MEQTVTKGPPFANMRRFMDEAFHYVPPTEVLDALTLDRSREAQCEGETVTCHVCGLTISASAMLACSACAS